MQNEKRNGSLFLYFLLAALVIATAILLRFLFLSVFSGERTLPTSGRQVRSVILDAGHGGRDGGAVSLSGTAEKELNLETTLTLAEILHLQGYHVILTRDSDTELTTGDGTSRKMQDLKGRLLIAQENEGIPFISIHMNKFPQSKYRGLQVYYSPNHSEGKNIAEAIQAAVRMHLQADNDRQIKKATSSIYLLHKITSPAVLIECGFLSNPEEAALLEQSSYRTSLALCIALGFDHMQSS